MVGGSLSFPGVCGGMYDGYFKIFRMASYDGLENMLHSVGWLCTVKSK